MDENQTKKRRVFTLDQKEAIVKGIEEYSTFREGLSQYHISSSTYYKWKRQLAEETKDAPLLDSSLPVPEEKEKEGNADQLAEESTVGQPPDLPPPIPEEKEVDVDQTKKRRIFTAGQKEAIVKGIEECSTFREGLSQYHISSSTYYKWKRQLAEETKDAPPLDSSLPIPEERGLGVDSGERPEYPQKEKRVFYPLILGLIVLISVSFLLMKVKWTVDKSREVAIPTPQLPTDLPTKMEPRERPKEPDRENRRALRSLDHRSYQWTGDFDEMLANRKIRVLLPHSRTLYFNDRGHERGLMGETIRDFERYLNKKYSRQLGHQPLTVFIIPETRDALLSGVANGFGDIAAGSITVTETRQKMVDFIVPKDLPPVSEILVTGPKSPPVNSLDDLSGKNIHVRKTSSYYESLLSLNERLNREREGSFMAFFRSINPLQWLFELEEKALINMVLVPDALEDEDLLEMLNAGIIEFLVVDSWKAKLWAQILPKIKVREDIVLRKRGQIGWAIRKGSPKLEAEGLDFYKNYLKKHSIREIRLAQIYRRFKQIKDPTEKTELKRFEQTIALFEKYGHRYNFDPLMLAAQGYQESTLDQQKISPVGAIGVMQIMPMTGASMNVGNIRLLEPNIHAGTKYMDQLMSLYFKGSNFDEQERTLFAFASYNAGPAKILTVRKLAKQRGLDPNKWFNNVEIMSTERIGLETTTYVRNIYKYFVAYKLMSKKTAEKEKARQDFPLTKGG